MNADAFIKRSQKRDEERKKEQEMEREDNEKQQEIEEEVKQKEEAERQRVAMEYGEKFKEVWGQRGLLDQAFAEMVDKGVDRVQTMLEEAKKEREDREFER